MRAQTAAEVDAALKAALTKYQNITEGKNADYIPALAKVDPKVYGISLVTVDGKVYSLGDIKTEVSIQSISKVFTMALVMEESGVDAIPANMGVDATGQVFNSIVAVEQYRGAEMNAHGQPRRDHRDQHGHRREPRRDLEEDPRRSTATSRAGSCRCSRTSSSPKPTPTSATRRSRCSCSRTDTSRPSRCEPTDIYTEQCAIGVNAKDLATMAATLANGGKNPVTGKQVVKTENVPEILAVMATAGLYDDSGKWLYKTGLPAKSGVGGGIIAVSPGKFGIAVVSPPLDEAGNSVRAQRAIADISNALGGNPLAPRPR